MTDMTGKTVLITGATSGIGEATARALARAGAHVFVHGPNAQQGESVVADIRKSSGNSAVEFVEADFSSLAAVRALAAEIKRRVPKLDVLINNAGRTELKRVLTADGFETMFGVNHLAPFLLTNLLLDTLKASAPARIVIVSSSAHKGKPLDFDNLNFENGGFSTWAGYHNTKLCNMLFMRALAKRLDGTGVTVNCLHPGVVRTRIGQSQDNPLFQKIVTGLIMLFCISPEKGAQTSVYLASAAEVAGVSGKYFAKCKAIPPHPSALDEVAAEKLWALSAKTVGLAVS